MAVYADREHFIPIRCTDLIDLLANDKGTLAGPEMSVRQSEQFRLFAKLIQSHYHREYYARLQHLEDHYAPFDPDAGTKVLKTLTPEERAGAQDKLFNEFSTLLERANYERMTRDEIEKEMQGASYWGIDMDVEWKVFERIELYHQGNTIGHRLRRHRLKFWRKIDVEVPTWQRMVLIIKQRAHKRLGKSADTEHVFLKLFKDIPRMDLEMLLPGTRIKMKLTERGKLGFSVASSIGYVAWKLSATSVAIFEAGIMALYAPIALILGYAYKTWSGFATIRKTYMLQLHQSLYYQNLDNNAGVINRLLDEAEEQEVREVLLAYFHLWRFAVDRAWTADELDGHVETDLEKRLNLRVDFEIGDALGKLERLQLLMKDGDGYRVRPIERAIAILEERESGSPLIGAPGPAATAMSELQL
jgi:hypothetical protein